ncbi:MAG: hypothetical protein U0411_02305 [Thermodesulfovibrionales bacterium]
MAGTPDEREKGPAPSELFIVRFYTEKIQWAVKAGLWYTFKVLRASFLVRMFIVRSERMRVKAFTAAVVMVAASMVGLYYHVTEKDTKKVIIKQEIRSSAALLEPPAEKESSSTQPVYQFSAAAPSSVGPADVSALISRYLPGKQDGFETRLKLSEALYENNYVPDARGIFNSLSDADVCGLIISKAPGTRCEGDMRAKLGELLYADGYLKLAKDLLTALVSESAAQMTNVGIDTFKTLRSAYRALRGNGEIRVPHRVRSRVVPAEARNPCGCRQFLCGGGTRRRRRVFSQPPSTSFRRISPSIPSWRAGSEWSLSSNRGKRSPSGRRSLPLPFLKYGERRREGLGDTGDPFPEEVCRNAQAAYDEGAGAYTLVSCGMEVCMLRGRGKSAAALPAATCSCRDWPISSSSPPCGISAALKISPFRDGW